MLYHQIGSTFVLGGYDAVPSDRQIADLLTNPAGDAGRIRARVIFGPDKVELHLPSARTEPAGPTT
jgi:hypothetical protein